MSMRLKGFLRLLPIVLLLWVVMGSQVFSAVTPASFVKPTSNYSPMKIYFLPPLGFNYNGLMPMKGDKVGVFDGELCVGYTEMAKNYSEYTEKEVLWVDAYKEDKQNNVVINAGFKEGDSMKFYLLVKTTNSVVAIPDSNVSYFNTESGVRLSDPVPFSGLTSALVQIHSDMAKLSISISPAGKGNTLPKADDYLYSIIDAEPVLIKVDTTATVEHYKFAYWTVDGIQQGTANQITVTMTKNTKVVANYELKKYTLTPVVNPAAGTVLPATPSLYTALFYADIFAKPVEGSGYQFSHWSCNPADAQIENANQASTRIMMTKNVEATAVFTLEKDSLYVTISPVNSGTASPLAGQIHVYDYGQTVNLVATPLTGWKFKNWLDNSGATPTVLSTDSSYSLLIKKNLTVEAVFEKKQYQVRLRANAKMGAIHINFDGTENFATADSLYTLPYGTQIKLKAVSADVNKYPFANWSGAVSTADNPIPVTVNTGLLIVANFEDTTPVELSSFSVQYAAHSVSRALQLKWETATETNNFGFDVERAFSEEKNWAKIGFIKGAGTTTQQKQYQFIDDTASEAGVYFYRLKQVDTNGAYDYSENVKFEVTAPAEYALQQNYPNPFNPTTNIVFQVKEEGRVTMAVFDLLGRQVKTLVDETMKPGTHRVVIDASDMSAGIYFYSLSAGSFSEMKKMTLIK
jgi:hypothetical protein